MRAFKKHTGVIVPLDRINVDTDQIIPKQFLKVTEKNGLGRSLFYDWRFNVDGEPRADFILNQQRYRNGTVLLTRRNFGCGSSREHAVWALADYGFKVLLAPSYADIFYNNCFKNGILPVALDEEAITLLFKESVETDGYSVHVDLTNQLIRKPNGSEIRFVIDQFRKHCLLEGLDDISLTLQHENKIRSHENKLRPFQIIVEG